VSPSAPVASHLRSSQWPIKASNFVNVRRVMIREFVVPSHAKAPVRIEKERKLNLVHDPMDFLEIDTHFFVPSKVCEIKENSLGTNNKPF
jgi:hypothetical protein